MVINQKWLVTSAAIFITYLAIALWLGITCELYMGIIIPQLILTFIPLTALVYALERQFKIDFLQNKINRSLKGEFKQMIEAVPEGILIFDEDGNQVFIANAEILKLAQGMAG
jgi:c-di-AMP phosphodiesterase-like protein